MVGVPGGLVNFVRGGPTRRGRAPFPEVPTSRTFSSYERPCDLGIVRGFSIHVTTFLGGVNTVAWQIPILHAPIA
jgi:hypothetical protein